MIDGYIIKQLDRLDIEWVFILTRVSKSMKSKGITNRQTYRIKE